MTNVKPRQTECLANHVLLDSERLRGSVLFDTKDQSPPIKRRWAQESAYFPGTSALAPGLPFTALTFALPPTSTNECNK